LRLCSAARKVSAPVGEAAGLGLAAGVPAAEAVEAGALDGAAEPEDAAAVLAAAAVLGVPAVLEAGGAEELVEELQAVNSTAIQASEAQAVTCRGLGAFRVLMMSSPFNVVSQLRRGAPRGGWKSLAARLTPRPVRHRKDG
jgi:hypothetical protein